MLNSNTVETLQPPSAKGLNLPNDPTPYPSHGNRKHVQAPDQYRKWDFLEGSGPSSSEMFHSAGQKKPFRVGWDQSKRHLNDIKDREPGYGKLEGKEATRPGPVASGVTARHQSENANRNKFNPITGESFNEKKGQWAPATDPWQHQPGRLKPAASIHAAVSTAQSNFPAAGAPRGVKASSSGVANVQAMRQDRLANDGLARGANARDTAASCLRWGA